MALNTNPSHNFQYESRVPLHLSRQEFLHTHTHTHAISGPGNISDARVAIFLRRLTTPPRDVVFVCLSVCMSLSLSLSLSLARARALSLSLSLSVRPSVCLSLSLFLSFSLSVRVCQSLSLCACRYDGDEEGDMQFPAGWLAFDSIERFSCARERAISTICRSL